MASLYFSASSGGCCGSTAKRTIVGGWAWAWWAVTDVQRLSLEVSASDVSRKLVEPCARLGNSHLPARLVNEAVQGDSRRLVRPGSRNRLDEAEANRKRDDPWEQVWSVPNPLTVWGPCQRLNEIENPCVPVTRIRHSLISC